MKVIFNKDPHIKGAVKDLIELPVVIRVGEINEKAAKEFENQITDAHNTGQDIVPIVIDSYGGDVYSLLSMISNIESSRLPISTICIGKAMSAGAVLLAHGTKGARFMDPSATIMIHEMSSGCWWSKITELKVNIEEIERLNKLVFQKMAHACGYKDLSFFLKEIQSKRNADWFVNCLEAKKLKIVDHIEVPEFHVNISSNIDFVSIRPKSKNKRKKNRRKK